MLCIVTARHPQPWPWPGEVSSRLKIAAERSIVSWRKRVNEDHSRSTQLGFLGTGLLGTGGHNFKLNKWKENYSMSSSTAVHASLMVDPAVWIVRTAVFYVLLETGIAGRREDRSSGLGDEEFQGEGLSGWMRNLLGGDSEQKRNKELSKVRAKWHASTKGTLVRRYRVPSKAGGRKLLSAISSLLADDDTFRDVATHKGCQVRRENAHAESVCCHNVRALFDELPTPHLVVEITVFPAGPITTAHYEKADKIEKVLRTGIAI